MRKKYAIASDQSEASRVYSEIIRVHSMTFPNYVFDDFITSIQLLSAEVSTCRYERDEAKSQLQACRDESEKSKEIFSWLLGETGYFPSGFGLAGKFYWRKHLREYLRTGVEPPAESEQGDRNDRMQMSSR
jgi:hypothetical protein